MRMPPAPADRTRAAAVSTPTCPQLKLAERHPFRWGTVEGAAVVLNIICGRKASPN
jgi:hypothetical protein